MRCIMYGCKIYYKTTKCYDKNVFKAAEEHKINKYIFEWCKRLNIP